MADPTRKLASPSVKPVPVCFTPSGLKALDAAVKRTGGFSRSHFVRVAVADYIQRMGASAQK